MKEIEENAPIKGRNAIEYQNELSRIAELGADIEVYQKLDFDYDQLTELRKGIEKGVDVSSYRDPDIPWFRMTEKRFELEHGDLIKDYIDKNFDWLQKEEIRLGIERGVDVSMYADEKYLSPQMKEIRLGLEDKLDISKYNDPEFDWFQMKEIREGLKNGINVDLYSDKKYNFKTMKQIRLGMEEGINLTDYLEGGCRDELLLEVRKCIAAGMNPGNYLQVGLEEEHLNQIRRAYEKNINIDPFLDPEITGDQLEEIIEGLEAGIDVSIYGKKEYSWRQMSEIRKGLENHIDVSSYANPHYSWQQMVEIRQGLEAGLDVSGYAKLIYSLTDMRTARNLLQEGGKRYSGPREAVFAKSIIFISEDGMTAELILARPSLGIAYTEQSVIDILKKNNVLLGIDRKAIKKVLREGRYEERFVAARGTEPVAGEDGRYDFYFHTQIASERKVSSEGFVDYSDLYYFEEVRAGQKLATYIPATSGKGGFTVSGKILLARKGIEKPVIKGSGFILLDDKVTYIAVADGKIEYNNYNIVISKLHIINGDISDTPGSLPGNFTFDGDLYIKGNISGRVSICATGSIEVEGSVGPAKLLSGGNILIKQGAVSAGTGLIQANGSIEGKSFEAVKVRAGNHVYTNYLINCDLKAGGVVVAAGRSGSISGGWVQADKGIETALAGSNLKIDTVLATGISEETFIEYNRLVKNIVKVRSEVCVFEGGIQKLKDNYTGEQLKEMSVYNRIQMAFTMKREELDKLALTKTDLEEKMNWLLGSKITVHDRIYPGTYVIIDTVRIRVNDTVSSVSFRHEGDRVEAYSN